MNFQFKFLHSVPFSNVMARCKGHLPKNLWSDGSAQNKRARIRFPGRPCESIKVRNRAPHISVTTLFSWFWVRRARGYTQGALFSQCNGSTPWLGAYTFIHFTLSHAHQYNNNCSRPCVENSGLVLARPRSSDASIAAAAVGRSLREDLLLADGPSGSPWLILSTDQYACYYYYYYYYYYLLVRMPAKCVRDKYRIKWIRARVAGINKRRVSHTRTIPRRAISCDVTLYQLKPGNALTAVILQPNLTFKYIDAHNTSKIWFL